MTEVVTYSSIEELEASVGVEIGPTEWLTIDQARVDGFAEHTDDRQWIHVDPERAKAGPFGGTIAHGFLTLSLVPHFNSLLRRVDNVRMGVNYGLNRVRFPAPVPVGGRVRARLTLVECERIGTDAVQLVSRATIEVEGSDKPACIAELVSRYYFDS